MEYNSKLTEADRSFLRRRMKTYNATSALVDGVTVLRVPVEGCNDWADFSVAYASPKEKKIRKTVGRWHAMQRYLKGEFMRMPARVCAEDLAYFIMENNMISEYYDYR